MEGSLQIDLCYFVLFNVNITQKKTFYRINPIMSGVHKVVKHTLKIFQQILQDFNICLIILWTGGIIGL